MREYEAEVGDGPLPASAAGAAPAAPAPASPPRGSMTLSPPPAPRRGRGFGIHPSSVRYTVDEDPVGHGGCDTPAPLTWRRITSANVIPGPSDLTLFIPRTGGLAKAVALYGQVPLFGIGPDKSSPVDGLSDRIVHEVGSLTSGIPVGIEELVKIMVHSEMHGTTGTMGGCFVSMCVPAGSAGLCGCKMEDSGAASVAKVCGQIITAPLWSPSDFDVWSTRMPGGMVPSALCGLTAYTSCGMVIRYDAARVQAQTTAGLRPQFYSCRPTEKPPKMFLGECCARTYMQEHTRRMLRPAERLPHPSVIDPVFGRPELVHVPVYKIPQGAAMSSLAATYSTFSPCSVPRVIALDRRTPGLASAKLTDVQWERVYGATTNFMLILTKSVAGCNEMRRDLLPPRCTIRLAPIPPPAQTWSAAPAGAALATPRGASAFKRTRDPASDSSSSEEAAPGTHDLYEG